jgi:hypothetical protein
MRSDLDFWVSRGPVDGSLSLSVDESFLGVSGSAAPSASSGNSTREKDKFV